VAKAEKAVLVVVVVVAGRLDLVVQLLLRAMRQRLKSSNLN
jgi:hypothetical protein